MIKKLSKLFKSRRTRSLEAQIAELRVAVSALLDAAGSANVADVSSEGRARIDTVLLHAAAAKVDSDRLDGLYEATLARIAATETRLDKIEEQLGRSAKRSDA